jgi:hypothetical protein
MKSMKLYAKTHFWGYLFCCLLSFCPLYSQIMVEKMLEKEITKDGNNYKVINLQKQGLLTVLESEEYIKGGNKMLILELYDTALTKKWETKPVLKYDHKISMYFQDQENFYLLVEKKSTAYDIMEVSLESGNIKIFKIEDIIPLEITHFKVFNTIIFIGGEIDNRPAVLWFDYQNEEKPKVLPQINTLKATLQQISFSQDQACVSVLLSAQRAGKPNLFIQNYTLDGHLLSKIAVLPDKEYSLLTFRPYIFSPTSQLVFGTYAQKASDDAQGFYVARFNANEQENIKFYDFSRFKNRFNYLTDKRKEKLFEKIDKKQQQGKVYGFDSNLLLSELLEYENNLYLFGDTYTRATVQNNSTNNSQMMAMYMGRNSPQLMGNTGNFGGTNNRNNLPNYIYKYQNCVVIGFDKLGNLLWDNAFEYKDLEDFTLAHQVALGFEKDSLTMLQVEKENFFVKKTSKALTINEIDECKTDTLFTDRKVIDEVQPLCFAWYENYFIAYNTQRLKLYDAQKGITFKEIFYIAKIYYTSRKKKKL